jgi:hypothetical protein
MTFHVVGFVARSQTLMAKNRSYLYTLEYTTFKFFQIDRTYLLDLFVPVPIWAYFKKEKKSSQRGGDSGGF